MKFDKVNTIFCDAGGVIADTAGICITKAMSGPLTGGTAEAAAKPWLILS